MNIYFKYFAYGKIKVKGLDEATEKFLALCGVRAITLYIITSMHHELIQTADLQLSVRIAFSSTYHQTRLEQTGSWVLLRSRFDPYVLPLWQIIFAGVEAVCLALISIEYHKPMKLKHLLINPE